MSGPRWSALATNEAALPLLLSLALLLALSVTLLGGRARDRRRDRMERAFAGVGGRARAPVDSSNQERSRRKAIEQTLKDLAAKQREETRRGGRLTLRRRLSQAGLAASTRLYVSVSIMVGAVFWIVLLGLFGLAAPLAGAFAIAGALALPHLYVERLRARRLRALTAELPDALDVIVRGVRSGLPLGDCLRSIAQEGREPVRAEFTKLTQDMAIGLPIDQATDRLYERAPTMEIRLLGIILSIQSQSGGNLAEAIGNLSGVLRSRKKMKDKIKAISSEATASAAIIGALPVMVALLMHLTAPDYIGLLFATPLGKIALGVGAVWMTMGVLVMRKMISFEV